LNTYNQTADSRGGDPLVPKSSTESPLGLLAACWPSAGYLLKEGIATAILVNLILGHMIGSPCLHLPFIRKPAAETR
jgi:hypothetical protein